MLPSVFYLSLFRVLRKTLPVSPVLPSFFSNIMFVKMIVERCGNILVVVSQIYDRVKSVALWSTNIINWPRTISATVLQLD